MFLGITSNVKLDLGLGLDILIVFIFFSLRTQKFQRRKRSFENVSSVCEVELGLHQLVW